VFLDPVHKVPRSLVFWCDFLNFLIKKWSVCLLDCLFECFLVQTWLGWVIYVQLSIILLFHHTLEHLVILIYLEYLFQRFSEITINSCTILSSDFLSEMLVVSMLLTIFLSSVTNFIELVSSQPVDWFSQTKLWWKAPNKSYLYICGIYKSNNKQLRYQAISNCKGFVG